MQGAGASRRDHRGVRTGARRSLVVLCALAAALLAVEEPGDDLTAVRERGALRVLLPRQTGTEHLPRRGRPIESERAHAAKLARELGVAVEWVYVDTFDELLPALLAGRGDLVVDNLTVTPGRRERVSFSAPVAAVRQQVVSRVDDVSLEGPADLVGRRVAVRRSSSHWETLEALRRKHPGIELVAAPEDLSSSEILDRVEQGEYDLTLADSNLVRHVLDDRTGLRVAFDLEGVSVIAWAMRPESTALRAAVDAFLTRASATPTARDRFVGDLDGLRLRGTLRVLTRNNAANYYIWNGQLMGFEYELAREFARRQGLELEIVVPPSHADLLPWLREGRGDLVAASLPASSERERSEGVAFSRATHRVTQVIVSRADAPPLASVADLAGHTVSVRREGHARRTLEALRESGIALEIEEVPDELEAEEIIEGVANGEYELTLADSHIVDIELTWRDDVRAALSFGEPIELAWAVRRSSPALLDRVNAFFEKEARGTYYNVLSRRYFRDPKRIRSHAASRPVRAGRITPYDDLVRKHADAYGFDWRLIAAMMQQESRFDPTAVSFAGARGLLQVMPSTAAEFGVENLEDPEAGILAGVRYLAFLRAGFEETLPDADRTWLALASYNAGPGHVSDARTLARQRGLDPDRWFGNVEQTMLLKRRRDVAAATRFGYCRCDESVRYVRAVRDRYRAYVRVAASDGAAPGGEPG